MPLTSSLIKIAGLTHLLLFKRPPYANVKLVPGLWKVGSTSVSIAERLVKRVHNA